MRHVPSEEMYGQLFSSTSLMSWLWLIQLTAKKQNKTQRCIENKEKKTLTMIIKPDRENHAEKKRHNLFDV